MPTDPRYVIKTLFNSGHAGCKVTAGNLLEEDGVTPAKFEADYEYNELMIQRLMLEAPFNIDLFFIITLAREDNPLTSPSGPVYYTYVAEIQPVTVHKYNADGTVKVNGDKLGLAATDEIKKVIRENPLGSYRTVHRRTENVQRVSGSLIYGDMVEVTYRQYSTSY